MDMVMTNYMDLLAMNQPWNLILFMVIPVGLAEALVATEFFTAFLQGRGSHSNGWQRANHVLGILAGVYFAGIVFYLVTHVLPAISWKGALDMAAIGAYLLGLVPLLAISLLELGVWGRSLSPEKRMKHHFALLIGFLVISHAAMIFGMTDPRLTGWQPSVQTEMQHDMGTAMQQNMSGHSMAGHAGHGN